MFKQCWYNGIANSRSLSMYKNFKQTYEFEHYLNVLPSKLRIPLSRLGLSAHQLRIETGRYAQNRVARALRLCTPCNKSDIEDEFHFVLLCPSYNQIRRKYIRPYYYQRPSVHKLIMLMQNTQRSSLNNLGKYVYEAFALRRALLTS